MGRAVFVLSAVISALLLFSEVHAMGFDLPVTYSVSLKPDTVLPDKQLLFNGRIWYSSFSNTIGNEFLLTKDWLNGDVNINDLTFNNLLLRYDVYNDQLLAFYNQITVVQLNKELIKEFSLTNANRRYDFENFGDEPGSPFNGFGQVLYKGKIYFIIKYTKQIKELAVENKYDEFIQIQTLFLLKDRKYYHISGKKDLFKALSDRDIQVRSFIRENNIKIRKNNPESFIPVIKFYDNLK